MEASRFGLRYVTLRTCCYKVFRKELIYISHVTFSLCKGGRNDGGRKEGPQARTTVSQPKMICWCWCWCWCCGVGAGAGAVSCGKQDTAQQGSITLRVLLFNICYGYIIHHVRCQRHQDHHPRWSKCRERSWRKVRLSHAQYSGSMLSATTTWCLSWAHPQAPPFFFGGGGEIDTSALKINFRLFVFARMQPRKGRRASTLEVESFRQCLTK